VFQALVILWNFETSQLVSKYDIHKVRVESVTFTCDSRYLISLGGRDDGNVIVWNIEKEEALCGNCHLVLSPSSSAAELCIKLSACSGYEDCNCSFHTFL
jgi:WD40 repeat protein